MFSVMYNNKFNILKLQLDIHNISVVGVHVRRGDKLQPQYQGPDHGYRIPEPSEILYAMNYMRLRHNQSVIFIIASDDKVKLVYLYFYFLSGILRAVMDYGVSKERTSTVSGAHPACCFS